MISRPNCTSEQRREIDRLVRPESLPSPSLVFQPWMVTSVLRTCDGPMEHA